MSEPTTTVPDLTAAFPIIEPQDEACGHEGCDKHLSDFKDLRGFRAHQRSHQTTICENCDNPIAGVAYAPHLKWCLEHNPPQPIDIEPWRGVDVSEVLPTEATTLLEALRRAGMNTVAEVLEHPRADFTAIPEWNDELTGQLRTALAGFDLKLPVVMPVLKTSAKKRRERRSTPSPSPAVVAPDPTVTDALNEVTAPLTAMKEALTTEQRELEERLQLVKGQLVRLDQAERALFGRSSTPRASTSSKKRRSYGTGRPPEKRLETVLEDVRANGPSGINDVSHRLGMTKGLTTKALETLRADEKLRLAGSRGNTTLYAVMEGAAENGAE